MIGIVCGIVGVVIGMFMGPQIAEIIYRTTSAVLRALGRQP